MAIGALSLPGGPGVVGAHHHHCVVVCCGAGGRFLSSGCDSVSVSTGIITGLSWWGPWCSFLIIISAHNHPLILPNLQAGACSGGNGWWVGVFCFRGFKCVSDVACLWGSLGADQVGIPLLGSPSVEGSINSPVNFPILVYFLWDSQDGHIFSG